MKISKSAIFLFELMIVILVFSIAAAICTSIFAKGYQYSSESENLTHAVINAESAAEKYKVNPTGASLNEVYFNGNWEETASSDDAAFTMTLTPSREGNLNLCEISVINKANGESIYQITVAKYQPN